MNRTKRNLIWSLIILAAGVVFGCRKEGPKILEPLFKHALEAGLKDTTKETVARSMVKAANEGGRANADKEFNKLFYDQKSPIRDDIKDLRKEAKEKLHECLVDQAMLAAAPELRERGIKSCFGPSPTRTP